MPSCTCTSDNHAHNGSCEKDGFSLSIEHKNEWLCKECYDHWIGAKQAVLDFQASLMTIAITAPDKLKQAQAQIGKILGGSQ